MTVSNNSAKALFQPIQVGSKLLQNRIVLAPLTRTRADVSGVPNQLVADYYSQRATPGTLLIAEATAISSKVGKPKGAPGIYNQDQVNGWKRVVDEVHSKQAAIYLQLWHTGRTFSPRDDSTPVVSASDIPIPGLDPTGKPYPTPKALTIPEIKATVVDFANAARNAIEAGFDGVEIHGANGYLIDQFNNTSSNQRSDIYGGTVENRARFALEVVDAVVEAIGAERTGIRFSPYYGFQGMHDVDPLTTWSYLTQSLQSRHPNLSFLHFIEPRTNIRTDDEVVADVTESLESFRSIWKGPFISAGGYSFDPKIAFDVAEQSPNNLVAFGRSYISNPDIVDRLRNGYPLHPYDRKTFYTPGAVGYTDYPVYAEDNQSSL
ncbi:hypothetical protein BCR42DRAFT_453789 [Absidia repens]|uniref:NADH:flavin oxidoreductase/NADH oxidase N-terminal domain-containing protein n=1 Tax=Absidia repens TaxID=90262 RepID=A0A1X2I8Q8_9FUNG|nr:hypothetical protein BCR42DRAFT_453789 [Absidia repens]